MAFTAQEIANSANALLDFHVTGPAMSQTIQDKPLYARMKKAQKTFPGGKDFITEQVKGVYTTTIQGFTHDDEVAYGNPANIKQAVTSWYEIHAGIKVTMTELKKSGISVVDTMNGARTSQHSKSEKIVLTNLLNDKIEDMTEGYARGMNEMFWRDGTQDSKQVPGIRSFLLDDPSAAGLTFGIDRTANTWWRNRVSLAIDSSTSSNLNVVKKLQTEFRQLRRYGGKPTFMLAGADFIEALENELRSKGNYTDKGWAVSKDGMNARFEASMSDISFKGVPVEYDPTLDDLSLAKYAFWMDPRRVKPWVMEGEDDKRHTPARPAEKYVMYRAMTWTGGLMCNQLNANGVYSIA